MPMWMTYLVLALICKTRRNMVDTTIDVNLSELEYLAAHLEPAECRRLVAALHYDDYELPKSLDGAERRVSPKIPCLEQLLHWNAGAGEGRGKTHEHIGHRLRQLGRRDLADWLGRTSFRELGKDLLRSIDEPFHELASEEPTTISSTSYPVTTESIDDSDDESFWLSFEVIVMVLFAGLLFTLLFNVGALVIDKIAWCENEKC